ncbi:hypothetical protein [Microcoleus sp. Pol12B4]|uniref:hypothetical protein n=1 Tax=Microcoleus sp. Pol12B4 TaxID=3055395 RepID=UPI002FCE742E
MNYSIFGLIAVPFLSGATVARPASYPAARAPAAVQVATRTVPPQKYISEWTDFIFYKLHPQLNRRKIGPDETQYINEWSAIQKVVRNNLVYEPGCNRRFSYDWLISVYDGQSRNGLILSSPVLNKVADAVFYTRHSELGYRRIQPDETSLASEWSRIRRAVSLLHPCD